MHLDRVGTASYSEFTTISFDEVKRYMVFDTEFCNLFTIGELIIQQGLKGVPIGGYLSAQVAEILAIWRESTFLYGDRKDLTETLLNAPASTWWDVNHPMAAYRRRVAEFADRHGDVWVKKHP